MTEQSEHLSSAQIENYGIRTSAAGPDAAQRDEHQRADHQGIDDQKMNDQSVEAHLADCPSCRNRLLDFHRSLFSRAADSLEADPPENDTSVTGHSPSVRRTADFKLDGGRPTDSALADSNFANPKYPAGPQVRTAPTPECPSEDALRQLAVGLTPGDLAHELTRHAATCDRCGPLLRSFTEDFSDDFSPEEQAILSNLKSASASWQKKTARKMLQVDTESTGFSWKVPHWSAWKWVPAFSFLLLLAAGASWVYPLLALHKATLAVEAEYRKGRPMKYRPAEVPYGPYEPERGRGDSRNSATAIKPNPGKAPVLAANAAFLVRDPDGYTKAILILEEAVRHHSSFPLLNNLAVAYAMAADNIKPANDEERKRQRETYDKALEITDRILQQNGSDPAALFNQALILERLGEKQKAIDALENLGRIEQDPGWRQEAADKLKLLRSLR